MSSVNRFLARASIAVLMSTPLAFAQSDGESPRTALRVCADPYSLPTSNKAGEGYENAIAELFGRKLGIPVTYEWFPQRIGFIRNTLTNDHTDDGSYKCDIVMGVVDNFEMAATTRPYMRSSWAMVYVRGRGLDYIKGQQDLRNLSPERAAELRIGIWDRGPGTDFIYQAGLMDQAIPFQSMSGDPEENPGKIIERDLVQDKINLTFVWGPIAGYYAKRLKDYDIAVIPMHDEPGIRFEFQIAMAVRFGDKAWRAEVNKLIEDNQDEIDAILDSYGVPHSEVVLRPAVGGNDDDD